MKFLTLLWDFFISVVVPIAFWTTVGLILLLMIHGCTPLPRDPAVVYWNCLNTTHSYVACDREAK